MPAFLSTPALRRVVQSVLTAELTRLRGRTSSLPQPQGMEAAWPDDLNLADEAHPGFACDSLDLLHLSAAINEMFHLYEVGLEPRLLQTARFGDWLAIIENAWRLGVEHITVTTSGSTGTPKRCVHSFHYLDTEIEYLATLFQGRSRIVALAPARHIYGLLFTALLPDRLHIPVVAYAEVCPGSKDQPGPATLFEPGDLLVSVPTVWQWLDRSISHWPANVEGVISTGPCPRNTIESLAQRGLSRVHEIYGSSETAGVGVRTWPEPYFTLMPQWKRTRSVGELHDSLLHASICHVAPMDELTFVDQDRFVLRSRKDNAVQVGGTNVFPGLIEQKLLSHAGVEAVSVRLMRPEEGHRLKCYVVPAGGESADRLRESLERWIATWPAHAERPKDLTFGSALPKNALGKACDW